MKNIQNPKKQTLKQEKHIKFNGSYTKISARASKKQD